MIFKINAENRLKQGEYPLFQTASLRAIKDDENNEAYGVMSVTFDMTPYKCIALKNMTPREAASCRGKIQKKWTCYREKYLESLEISEGATTFAAQTLEMIESRIRGQVPDSCLSCEFFNPLGRDRIHQGSKRETLFSTSKDDSLDKKQIQIIVVIFVKVVKLIFDSAPQLLRSYEGYESVTRIVRHLFSTPRT